MTWSKASPARVDPTQQQCHLIMILSGLVMPGVSAQQDQCTRNAETAQMSKRRMTFFLKQKTRNFIRTANVRTERMLAMNGTKQLLHLNAKWRRSMLHGP